MEDASGNTFETEYKAYVAERDDLTTPHQCTAELESPDVGAPLDQLEAYAEEFHKMVEEMFAKLPDETRLLEGTEIPSYDDLRKEAENELSPNEQSPSNGQCTGDVAS
jgi:hypothetical protein